MAHAAACLTRRGGVFESRTSEVLLAELLHLLGRSHLVGRTLRWPDVAPTVEHPRKMALMVTPPAVLQVLASDRDDDHVVAATVAAVDSSPAAIGAICCFSAPITTSHRDRARGARTHRA